MEVTAQSVPSLACQSSVRSVLVPMTTGWAAVDIHSMEGKRRHTRERSVTVKYHWNKKNGTFIYSGLKNKKQQQKQTTTTTKKNKKNKKKKTAGVIAKKKKKNVFSNLRLYNRFHQA